MINTHFVFQCSFLVIFRHSNVQQKEVSRKKLRINTIAIFKVNQTQTISITNYVAKNDSNFEQYFKIFGNESFKLNQLGVIRNEKAIKLCVVLIQCKFMGTRYHWCGYCFVRALEIFLRNFIKELCNEKKNMRRRNNGQARGF